MLGFFILIILISVLFLFLVGQFSRSYKTQRTRLTDLVERDVLSQIENIKTYGREENGWKNNFPSVLGWDRTTLRITKNSILVTGRSKFPFIFKSELQPFALATDVYLVKNKLNFDRVYVPSNIRITNYGDDLELTIKPHGLLGEMKIHLIFEAVGKTNLERIMEITNWQPESNCNLNEP